MNCVKCNSQGGFLCKCGTRYCGRACQQEHWKIHKPSCIAASIKMKAALDKTLKVLVNDWDEMKCNSFAHFSKKKCDFFSHLTKAEVVHDRARDPGPYGLVMCYENHAWSDLVKDPHYERVMCREWLLVLSDGSRKNVTSVMIESPGESADRILSIFAPEHAMPGWATLHFFDYDRAISAVGSLMCVD